MFLNVLNEKVVFVFSYHIAFSIYKVMNNRTTKNLGFTIISTTIICITNCNLGFILVMINLITAVGKATVEKFCCSYLFYVNSVMFS